MIIGHWGLFSRAPPYLGRSWNGTHIQHVLEASPQSHLVPAPLAFCASPGTTCRIMGAVRSTGSIWAAVLKKDPSAHSMIAFQKPKLIPENK